MNKIESIGRELPFPRVAFFDLDGTLINQRGEISAECRAGVEGLKRRDVAISLATGRPFFSAAQVISLLGVQHASMFFSGALIVTPGAEIISESLLPIEASLELIALCEAAGLHLELYTREEYFIAQPGPLSEIHTSYLLKQPTQADLRAVAKDERILKAVIMVEEADRDRIPSISEHLPGFGIALGYGAAHPELTFVNVTNQAASREECFGKLIDHFQVRPEETIAFGDAESDIPFLKLAGIGVAMGNAPEAVKAAADVIAPPVEHGGVGAILRQVFARI